MPVMFLRNVEADKIAERSNYVIAGSKIIIYSIDIIYLAIVQKTIE